MKIFSGAICRQHRKMWYASTHAVTIPCGFGRFSKTSFWGALAENNKEKITKETGPLGANLHLSRMGTESEKR